MGGEGGEEEGLVQLPREVGLVGRDGGNGGRGRDGGGREGEAAVSLPPLKVLPAAAIVKDQLQPLL